MITFRQLNASDHATICNHRQLMFAEMGTDPEVLARASALYAQWLEPRLADGSYFGFIAEDAGAIIAGAGLRIMDFPPNPNDPESNRRGFVLDVYVQPSHRGQGIAYELMQRGEAELKRRGIAYATLQASEKGRPLYKKLGWTSTTEMGKKL
jgi:GNAT superfamily N-acetyltransferase